MALGCRISLGSFVTQPPPPWMYSFNFRRLMLPVAGLDATLPLETVFDVATIPFGLPVRRAFMKHVGRQIVGVESDGPWSGLTPSNSPPFSTPSHRHPLNSNGGG